MIINFSNLGGGGGGGEYVLPAATENRLGGVKIGNGVNVAADGTISVDGGGSGDSNYLIVDSLDEIENPIEGMRAYVKARTDYENIEGITFDISNAIGGGDSGRVYFGYVESLGLEFPEDNTVQTVNKITFSRVTIEDDVLYTDGGDFWFKKNGNSITAVFLREYDHDHYEFMGALEGASYEDGALAIPINYPAKNYIYKNEWKSTDLIFVNKMTNEERAELVAEVDTASRNQDDATMNDIFSRIRVNEGMYEARKYSYPLTIVYDNGEGKIKISFVHRWGQEGEWGYNMVITINRDGYLEQKYGETTASQNNLGVVKIGSGINISDDGTISVEGGGDGLEIVNYNDIDTAKGQEIYNNPEKYAIAYGKSIYTYVKEFGVNKAFAAINLNYPSPTPKIEICSLFIKEDGSAYITDNYNAIEVTTAKYISDNFYTKDEIDNIIGNIETLLSEI